MSTQTKPALYQQAKALGVTDFGAPYNKLTKEALLVIIQNATPAIVESVVESPSSVILVEADQGESISESAPAFPLEVPEVPALEIVDEASSPVDIIVLEGVSDMDEKGKFYVQNQRLLLTYKTHLPKEDVKTFFEEKNAKETIVAHEVASSETNYEHSHVYVDFGRRFQSANARIFDIKGIHPNIKLVKTSKHLENIWAYLCKEDHENDYLLERLTKKSIFDVIANKPTIQDALRIAKSPSEASGIALMYQFKEQEAVELPNLPHQWQKELLEELKNKKPSHREIIWYYDPVGGTGKSDFTKHACVEQRAAVFTALGGDRDAAQLILTARASGWDGRVVITDLPRDAETRSIYSPLEAIKNGMITSTKYQGGTSVFNRPHVVVFANFLPELSGRMSHDKWDIRKLVINPVDHSVTCHNLTRAEALKTAAKTANAKRIVDEILHSTRIDLLPTKLALESIIRDLQDRVLRLTEDIRYEEVIEE